MKAKLIRTISVVVIITLGAGAMAFLSSTKKETKKREAKKEIRTVNVQDINFENMVMKIKGNGTIQSQRSLKYVSEVSGKVVFAKNDLKTGTYVEENEIVLKIDSREEENRLRSMRSDFINSVASMLPDMKIENMSYYNKWYKYFTSLDINVETELLPEIKDDQEKIMVSSRNIFTKFYNVKNQEIKVSKHFVSAPFQGYLRSNNIIENSFVSVGTTLFEIDDVYNLEIAVPLLVSEARFINFDANPIVEIYADESMTEKLTGKIFRKDTKLEASSQQLNAYVVFKNNELSTKFLPGNYVTVLINGQSLNNVAEIPRHLIDGDNAVYTIEEGKLNKRNVEIVAAQDGNAIIKNTIPVDIKLVTTLLQRPLIGMEIQSVEDAKRRAEEEKLNESEELSEEKIEVAAK